MTIKLFNGSNWNSFAKRIRIFSGGSWTSGTKSVKVYRDTGGLPFWNVVYPEKPVAQTTPIVTGSGLIGTNFELSAGLGFPNIQSIWLSDDYIKPQTITYQWQRSPNNSAPWTNLGSLLTSYAPYLITSADQNQYIRCVITATNAKDSTVVNSFSQQVYDPTFTFSMGSSEIGVAAAAGIYFDKTSGSFPVSDTLSVLGRVFSYFNGFYKTFDLWYRSDSSTFRIYHRLYNAGNARPSIPSVEYEIVFYNNSNIVDLFIINPSDTSLFYTNAAGGYSAFSKDYLTVYKSYSLFFYYAGSKTTVPLDGSTSITYNVAPSSNAVQVTQASLTSNVARLTTATNHNLSVGQQVNVWGLPTIYNGSFTVASIVSNTVFTYSITNANIGSQSVNGYATYPPAGFTFNGSFGWIPISSLNDLNTATQTFSTGAGLSSNALSPSAFTKSNMFWPNSITNLTTSSPTTTTVDISWSNSGIFSAYNAGSYSVQVSRVSDGTIVFGPTLYTSTSATISNLSTGTQYNIFVTPNSRSDGLGQTTLGTSLSYTHTSVPGVPRNLAASVNSDTQITLTWDAPLDNGGSSITGYTVQYKKNADASWSTWATNGETDRDAPITGLTSSTLYNFRVAAVNSIGTGPYTAQVNATTNAPATAPGAVRNLATSGSPTIDAFGFVVWTITWDAPTSDGGAAISKYEWATDLDAAGTGFNYGAWNSNTTNPTSRTTNVTIFNTTQAYVKVRAVNSAGNGTETFITLNSGPSAPGKPTVNAVSNTNKQSTVSWTASNANGGTSLSYRVFRSQNLSTWNERTTNAQQNTSWTETYTQANDGGKTYYYRTTAYNTLGTTSVTGGTSPESEALVVPNLPTAPAAPTINKTRIGTQNTFNMSAQWSAANSNNGGTVNYQVFRGQNQSNVNTSVNSPSGTSQQNTSLSPAGNAGTAGQTYYFRVLCTNSWGSSNTNNGSITL